MGLFDSFFGGVPELPDIDPAQSLEESREYWQQYNQFRAEAESEYNQSIRDLEVKKAFGRLNEDQFNALSGQLKKEYQNDLRNIDEGPTAQILKDEYAFQRSVAEQGFQSELIAYGRYNVREDGSASRLAHSGEEDVYEEVPASQVPSRPEFKFSRNFKEFYDEKMGEVEVGEIKPTSTSSSLGSARRAVAGGSTSGRSIGVGQIYRLY